jgi:putative protease
MKTDRFKPELLAPASNLATALTAFDCGADAVYAGMGKFNARERADNFTPNDMSRLIAFARKSGKKVYLALNTLLKESELPELLEMLSEIMLMQPDAVIVQDLGVLKILQDYFPEIPIHASTQMGIHNSAGVKLAEKLNIKRVIMERQVSLDELKLISETSNLELEVFIHGALCCSLSGNCLFSSWLGGWSGNRGKCKQPCRRRFYSKDGNGFFFSTQDLYGLELLPELCEMGIASLKIEGRLRKPDYVKSTVTAYRMILDAPTEERKKLIPEARNILSKSYGRKWSNGFYSEESAKELIQYESMGVAGLSCGRVIGLENNGFEILLSRRLHVGDRIRIQPESGEEGPALTVTKIKQDGQIVNKALQKQKCFIYCNKEVPLHGVVYKIGEGNNDEQDARIDALPLFQQGIEIEVKIYQNEIQVFYQGKLSWSQKLSLENAESHPLQPQTVEQEFKATSLDKLKCASVSAEINGEYFFPASLLKQTRREFWNWAAENLEVETENNSVMLKFYEDYQQLKSGKADPAEREIVAVKPGGHTPGKGGGVARSIFDINKETVEAILPHFCPETRLGSLMKKIRSAYSSGIRRFRVTSLYGVEMLKEYQDIVITASYPLPASNSFAVSELASLGVKRVQAWLELEKDELDKLASKSSVTLEIYRYGRPALLATRAFIPAEGKIRDSRSNKFFIHKDTKSGLSYVYPAEVLSIPRIPGTVDFYDLTNSYWNEKFTTTFNFEHALI